MSPASGVRKPCLRGTSMACALLSRRYPALLKSHCELRDGFVTSFLATTVGNTVSFSTTARVAATN